jgi:formylglycine-generating enzyme required for sulfatase activity
MTRSGTLARVVFLGGLLACSDKPLPPKGQLLIHVDTDAPLAPPAGTTDDGSQVLFDRLRVEILAPGVSTPCGTCGQELAVDRGLLDGEKLSFGARLEPGRPGYRAHVMLFRAEAIEGDVPRADATIDATFALPTHGDEGVVEATVFLPVDTAGLGPAAEAPASAGRTYRHKRLDGAKRTPCAGVPLEGEACVPGGAYWMSNPRAAINPLGEDLPQRIVVLAPFFVDRTEVTVRQLRAAALSSAADPVRGSVDGIACTYTPAAGPNEDLPVTCVSWDLARRYCERRGGALPTEAQWEYLASGLRGGLYPWGAEAPTCGDAVFGRWGGDPKIILYSTDCVVRGIGPQQAGAGPRDTLSLTGGAVVDIAGNVAEWSLDFYAPLSDTTCWGPGLRRDPLCEGSGRRTTRGGSWASYGYSMRAGLRSQTGTGTARVGFRCARPDP